jgi:hypothetical protein
METMLSGTAPLGEFVGMFRLQRAQKDSREFLRFLQFSVVKRARRSALVGFTPAIRGSS